MKHGQRERELREKEVMWKEKLNEKERTEANSRDGLGVRLSHLKSV